jgi:hypothetical protein
MPKEIKPKKKSLKKKLSPKTALFIKDEDGFYCVSLVFLKSLNYEQAMNLGLSTLEELREMMMQDSIEERDSLINGVKVIVGLNNTLSKLQTLFPEIINQIHQIEKENNPHKHYTC